MPFRSLKQRRYMWWKHPRIAKRWTKRYGSRVVPKKASSGTLRRVPSRRKRGRKRR